MAGLFLLVQTPYSQLGEALSKGRMARYPPHWMICANWLAQGDRQCVAPLNDLGFPRAGPFFYLITHYPQPVWHGTNSEHLELFQGVQHGTLQDPVP